ncbi:MAG: 50S ribosomal protein L24 [Methanosarcinales archaeon]|nr:50S ribosomal protein L24 [Methanosarcinales archaeon]
MVTAQPRKQRKLRYNAPLHLRMKYLGAPLSKELREEHNRRSFTIRKGDTVKVLTGDFKGTEGEVDLVNLKKAIIVVDGVVSIKADGTEVPRPLNPSNVVITKLDLSDKKRELSLKRGV